MLRRPAVFELGNGVSCQIPLERTAWDAEDLGGYEAEFVGHYAEAVGRLPSPVTSIDVGADIGVFSLKVVARCPNIGRAIAVEPNASSSQWLERNLAGLRIPHQLVRKGLADYAGNAVLRAPEGGDHAANFVEAAADGDIEVQTLDALEVRGGSIAIKIDVEGGELAVLRGARETIRSAADLVIGMEAHSEVCRRTGRDPVLSLQLLAALRPFRFVAAETGRELSTESEVFGPQLGAGIYNIICTSRPG